jgi:hypothetical protein
LFPAAVSLRHMGAETLRYHFSLGAINMDKKFKILFGIDVNDKIRHSNPGTGTSIVPEDRTTSIPIQNSTSHTNIP